MQRLILCLLAISLTVLAQKRVITHEDVWTLKRTGEPIVSPNGKLVIFSVTEPHYDPAKASSDLWMAPTDASAPAWRLTATKGGESGAVFSPDGSKIAFSAKREGDDTAQIYILPLTGGEAYRVTDLSTGARNPQWRPDGQAILFESTVFPSATDDDANKKRAAERKARKFNARVYDTFPIRHWNAWLEDTTTHIFAQELKENAIAADLLAGTKLAAMKGFSGKLGGVSSEQNLQPVWAADGQSIVFAAETNAQESMYAKVEPKLFRVPAKGGEPEQLTPEGYGFSNPKFSADGKTLYALAERSPADGHLYSLSRLVRIEPGRKLTVLTANWDRSVTSYFPAPDQSIYIEAEDEGFDRIFTLPAQGGSVKEIAKGYTNPMPTPNGLIARYGTSSQPSQIVLYNPTAGNHKMISNFDAARIAQIDWRLSEHFWFVAKNGKRIHNLITYPPNFDQTKKYPLLIFPHGGPNAMSKDAFSFRWNYHLLASQGYVLLQTDYTGSTGFGEKFADDIERDVLRGPAQEILEAIEVAAQKYPFIDKSRQAAAGASYGGYLMNWLNGHTDQFKCLVNHAGAVNNESQYGTNDGGLDRELRMGGPVWEHGGQWNDQSPIRYSGKFKTPTLITQGELDFRVPLSESMTTFKILQRRKVPTRLVLFPDEGHWILKGEISRKHMEEVLGWLRKYL